MGPLDDFQRKMYLRDLNKAVSILTWEDGTLIKMQRKIATNLVRGESILKELPLVNEQKLKVEECRERVKKLRIILGLPLDASKNQKGEDT